MASRTFQAVVFDLYGTLIQNLRREEFEFTLSGVASTLSVSSVDFVRLWNETWDRRSVGYYGSLESDIANICRMLGTDPDDDLLPSAAQTLRSGAVQVLGRCRDDALETLKMLKESGYKTGLISNCASNTSAAWQETALAELIDAPVFSCSARVRKPAREIYLLTCDLLSSEPERCLYVADGNAGELTGANQAGMRAVLFNGPDEDPYDGGLDRKEWTGPSISELNEVLSLLS